MSDKEPCGCDIRDEVADNGLFNKVICYCPTHASAFRYKEALEKIEARKLEDLPRDKKKDEFHKTLMAIAAWVYCSSIAREALKGDGV